MELGGTFMKRKMFILLTVCIIGVFLIFTIIDVENNINRQSKDKNEETLESYLKNIETMTEENVVPLKETFMEKEKTDFNKRTKN